MDLHDWKVSDVVNIPLLLLLLKMLWDAVYKTVPEGFAALTKVADEAHGRADVRHAEHMLAQKKIRRELKRMRKGEPKKKTPRLKVRAHENGAFPET